MSETVHITDSLCGDVETEADVYTAYTRKTVSLFP